MAGNASLILSNITSGDLITTVHLVALLEPSSTALRRVITISLALPYAYDDVGHNSPNVTSVTFPCNWFLAEIGIAHCDFSGRCEVARRLASSVEAAVS